MNRSDRLRCTVLVAAVALAGAAAPRAQGAVQTPPGGGARRVALVIGNAAYAHAAPLQNATNDATDIAEALGRYGFSVVSGTDLTQEQMDRALLDFQARAQGAEAAAFYYAGHGVQVDGENYLLPVDAELSHQSQVRYRALALGQVMGALEDTRAAFKLVILDACRDNPFAAMRTLTAGLANPSVAPTGSFIAYATAPGRRASDNPTGRNGLFTAAILEEIRAPGVEITQVFQKVRNRVDRESGSSQSPWTSTSYTGEFYFAPPDGSAPAAGAPAAPPAQASALPASPQVFAWAAEGAAAFHARNYVAALPLLTRAASAGDAPSQTRLAVVYQNGWAGPPDEREAVRLYQLAATRGDAVAQGNLGYMYHHGRGVPVNLGEAVRLYRLAADQGRASARNNLATLYQTGAGVPRDDVEAVRLYRLAATGGLAEAQANLAFMVETGRGVAADCAQALALYSAAGAAGHAGAAARARTLTCEAAPAGAGQ